METEVMPMDIGWFRDFVICIWGLVATVVVIFVAVISYLLYRRTRAVLNSMEAVSNRAASVLESVEAVSTTVREVAAHVGETMTDPVLQVIALVRGVRQGIDAISKLFRKGEQEGGGNNE